MGPVINHRLWSAFERRLAVEALIGDGDFFVPNATYREYHNRPLALRQLVLWAQERDAFGIAEEAIIQAVREFLSRSRLEDAIDLLWSLLVVGRASDIQMPISFESFRALAEEVVDSARKGPVLGAQAAATLRAIQVAAGAHDFKQE